ncbi:SWIM zinc finger family protein [Streptomyces sp. Qhu-G9]|uniref:SWIM zinc finger family protein n=1 Tax=Streptomyces sp. Qhu-G9 TaxID=3452799 RepID=UPI0022AC0A17|nr:SWIM zinc finger family protein [Streptomyces aurantiacus]WAU84152.1 SWIM zinc finger family protein [Streptomyces aurantiacus]
MSGAPESGPPGAASAAARPGDVAREALRAARAEAERERTAAHGKGVGARRRRGGAEPAAPGPRPATSNREAAAKVRELAERLGGIFELSSRLEREDGTDGPDTDPGIAHRAVPPGADGDGRPAGTATDLGPRPGGADVRGRCGDAEAGPRSDDAPPRVADADAQSAAGREPDRASAPGSRTMPTDDGASAHGRTGRDALSESVSDDDLSHLAEGAPDTESGAAPRADSAIDTGPTVDTGSTVGIHSGRSPGTTPDSGPGNTPVPPSGTGPAPAHRPRPTRPPGPADSDESWPEPHSRPAQSLPAAARSMAAPARDGELRRTFPALPPRPQGADGFAGTWWGNAWVAALEEMALDAARLGRGKTYAGQGHVDAITVTPGLVLAYVHGSRPRPYRVQIRMRTLPDDDWERFLDTAAEHPGHIAALLDKDLPQSLADSGVGLLPGPGDLVPRCSCPDSGHPCKHAAALCYQTARLLDEDPFVLLLMRGRSERELLDELSRRNATLAARSARSTREPALPGVLARDAVEPRTLPPLPAPLPPPPHPEQPPAYPASPGGPDPFALDQLATDAAARAHALLTTGRDPLAELTLWQDAVRLAANRPGSGLTATTRALYASLATAAGRTPADLARAVAAWRQGGLEGLAVLEEPWDPPAGRFDRARPLLLAADFPAFRPWHNHLTHPRGHIQLRLGHDGLWYAYESEPGHDDWWPRGTPDLDPVGALTGLGSPTDV